jgi:hypothetical protein
MTSTLFYMGCDMTSNFLSSKYGLKCDKSPGPSWRCFLSYRKGEISVWMTFNPAVYFTAHTTKKLEQFSILGKICQVTMMRYFNNTNCFELPGHTRLKGEIIFTDIVNSALPETFKNLTVKINLKWQKPQVLKISAGSGEIVDIHSVKDN